MDRSLNQICHTNKAPALERLSYCQRILRSKRRITLQQKEKKINDEVS